jgi:hypothetical protein
MMTEAQELIQSIKAKQAEQAKCLAVLDLWAAVQAQGIDIGTVDKFGFKEDWMTRIEKAQRIAAQRRFLPDPFKGSTLQNGHYTPVFYNYVTHKDGSITRLQPTLKAP